MSKVVELGGLSRERFIGHQVRLTEKHPTHAGRVGIFLRNDEGYPVVQLEINAEQLQYEDVVVIKSNQWELT